VLFGRLWYKAPQAIKHAIGYAMHSSRSADAVIRVHFVGTGDNMVLDRVILDED